MTPKKFFILFLILHVICPFYGQIEKKIPEDPYGITYDDVFENMHYNQPLRPQVHYTPITGQIGDATGLILYKGTYHLFYMYDEWSRRRKYNKSWGHAVSTDLIFWEQLPQILNTQLDNAPGSGMGLSIGTTPLDSRPVWKKPWWYSILTMVNDFLLSNYFNILSPLFTDTARLTI